MSLELSAAVAVFIFAVLAVFIIITLVRFNRILRELGDKSRRLDSVLNAISNLGQVCEIKTNQLKANTLNRQSLSSDQEINYYPELASLVVLGLKLGEKFLKNR